METARVVAGIDDVRRDPPRRAFHIDRFVAIELVRPVQQILRISAGPNTPAGIDLLALSKMNWNNAQLDERDPLTLRTAARVGSILRHVPTDGRIATRYAYYM